MSSKQSNVIPNREYLIQKEKELLEQFPFKDTVKRPDWWYDKEKVT